MLDEAGHLKLIDFGLCKKIRTASQVQAMLVEPAAATFDLEPMSPCGSLAFVPPETLEQLGSFAGDWWGMGVIAFELLTGHFPWRNVGTGDDDALRAEIREGLTDMPDGILSRSATSLLRGLLEMDVPRRLGFFSSQQVGVRGRASQRVRERLGHSPVQCPPRLPITRAIQPFSH